MHSYAYTFTWSDKWQSSGNMRLCSHSEIIRITPQFPWRWIMYHRIKQQNSSSTNTAEQTPPPQHVDSKYKEIQNLTIFDIYSQYSSICTLILISTLNSTRKICKEIFTVNSAYKHNQHTTRLYKRMTHAQWYKHRVDFHTSEDMASSAK